MHIAISFVQLMMFVRAVLSFLPIDMEGALGSFVFAATEPAIYPIRRLFEKFGFGDGLPIDIPFFVTFLILSFLSAIF